MSWGGAKKEKAQSSLTPQTQALLDSVMKQRGLSQRATQQAMDSLTKGDGQWINTISTGTANFQAATSKKTTVAVPKFKRGGSEPFMMPGPPASFSGKRMAHQIPQESLQREQFQGAAPGPDRDAEKDRLSRVMELGAKGAKEMDAKMARLKAEALERASRNKSVDVREELIDQIIAEIKERREFLESMRAAGKAAQYEGQIRTDIIVRMRELERMGVDVSDGAKPLQPGQLPGHAPSKPPIIA